MFKGELEGDLKGYLKGDLKGDLKGYLKGGGLGGRLGGRLQRGLQLGLGRGLAVNIWSVKVQVWFSIELKNSFELDSNDLFIQLYLYSFLARQP